MTWSIERTAQELGIAQEHMDVFEAVVELTRTPEAVNAERDRLKHQMEQVDKALHEAGIDYPLGAQGVRDLGGLFQGMVEDRDQHRNHAEWAQGVLKGINGVLVEQGCHQGVEGVEELVQWLAAANQTVAEEGKKAEELGKELRDINSVLRTLGIEKEGRWGVNRLAAMYEEARDKDAEEDLKQLKENLDYQLRRVKNVGREGVQGLRELADLYLAMQDQWVHDHRYERVELELVQAPELGSELAALKAELHRIAEVLVEHGCFHPGLEGVRKVVQHDKILMADAVATNKVLEQVGDIRQRGSVGVQVLWQRLREAQEEIARLKALELVGKPKPGWNPPSVIDRMGAYVADGHLVFEKDTEA